MKYLVRSVKYFFYFSFICAAMVSILVLIGAANSDINTIFRDGYKSIAQIALFFALVAAVYPKLGFANRGTYIREDWSKIKSETIEYMYEKRYVLESESDQMITFRLKGFAGKAIKMYEDRITLAWNGDMWFMEGLRKDVMRLSSGLEHRLTKKNEE